MTFVVALTGGIGSGKSTVSALFEKLGAEVIDTDAVARELTLPGTKQFEAIRREFGDEVTGPDGALARDKLRERVFSDKPALERLEAILHPAIRAETIRRVSASKAPYVILVVPLLVEKGGYEFADRTLVVDCSPQVQIERVMRRSKLTSRQIEAIMKSQAPRDVRKANADDLLLNEDGIDSLATQVEALHKRYLEMSGTPG